MICLLIKILVIYIKLFKIRWWWMRIVEYFNKLYLDVVYILVNWNFIVCKIIILLLWKLFVDIFFFFVLIIKLIDVGCFLLLNNMIRLWLLNIFVKV